MPCTYQNAKKKEARSARPPTGDWRGFPGGSDGEESACNAGDPSSIPGLGRSPGEENGKGTGYTHCDDKPSTAAVKVGAKKDNVMTRKCFQRVKKKKKKKKRNSGGRGHPWARLTVGFGEASHRDWLETQACCWAHQTQGHCADRQLVQLKDRGLPSAAWLPTPVPSSGDLGHRAQHSETRSCSTSELPSGAGHFVR